jgi:hypothetical protein
MTAAPTPSPGSAADQERQIADLRRSFADLRKSQSSSGVVVVLLVIVIVVEFAAFAYYTKERLHDNFSQTAIQKAVSDKLPQVYPVAAAQLQKAATNAIPTYRQLASERFEKLRPQLAANARARLERIPEDTGKVMNERLHTAFEGALSRLEPDIKAAFPSLTDAQKTDLLNAHFHDAINQRNKDIAAHIDHIYTNELTTVHAALDKFEVPPADVAPSSDRAQRDFLHTMLVLADYELMNGDMFGGAGPAGGAVDTGGGIHPPRPHAQPTTAPTTQAASAAN